MAVRITSPITALRNPSILHIRPILAVSEYSPSVEGVGLTPELISGREGSLSSLHSTVYSPFKHQCILFG